MLFFISVHACNRKFVCDLNTSHVILYLYLLNIAHIFFYNLNTSHVILYRYQQYHGAIRILYLNTSHVILYPTYLSHFLTAILLQPLYLSGFLLYFTTLDPLFQFLP